MAKIAFVDDMWVERLGIMLLSAGLKKAGHQTRLFMKGVALFDSLRQYSPDIVSFSTISGSQHWALQTAQKIKTILPHAVIIMGGPHPTFFPEVIGDPGLDAICRGEGEEAIVELANAAGSRQDITHIRNLWVKDGDTVYRNEPRPLIGNISSFPWADREIYYAYSKIFRNFHSKRVYISRGCVYNCSYCHNHVLKDLYRDKGRFFLAREIDDIIEEMECLVRTWPLKTIAMTAESLTSDRKWALQFLDAYRRRLHFPFVCNTTFNELNEEMVIALKEAGVHCLFIGLESGNEDIRREVLQKHISNDQIAAGGRLLGKHGVRFMTYNMVGNPGETIDKALETVALNRRIKVNFPWCSILQPYARTGIFDYAMKGGYIDQEDVDRIPALYMHSSVLRQPDIKKLECLQKLFILVVEWRFIPQWLIRLLISLPLKRVYSLLFLVSFALTYRKRNNLSFPDLVQLSFLTMRKYAR